MSLEHVLMEAARQEDELKNISKKMALPTRGDEVQVVRPSPVPWHTLDEKELGLVQAMFEHASWWDVLDTSPIDDVTLTRTLVALKKKGVIDY